MAPLFTYYDIGASISGHAHNGLLALALAIRPSRAGDGEREALPEPLQAEPVLEEQRKVHARPVRHDERRLGNGHVLLDLGQQPPVPGCGGVWCRATGAGTRCLGYCW